MRIPAGALLALALVAALAAPAQAGAAAVRADLDAAYEALAPLAADGRLSDEMAPYVVEALAWDARDPAAWPGSGTSALALAREALEEHRNGGLIERLRPLHALAMAGDAGPDHPEVARVLEAFSEGQFGNPDLLNDDMWALLVLARAGVLRTDARIQEAAATLVGDQSADGSWSWQRGGTGTSDETAFAIVALAAVGRLDEGVAARGIAFIADQTYPVGGTATVREGPANCNSTVWSIRAHEAAGTPPSQRAWQFLHGLRRGDGFFTYIPEDGGGPNLFCTLELMGLLAQGLAEGWDMEGYGGPDARGSWAPAAPAAALVALACAALRRRGRGA